MVTPADVLVELCVHRSPVREQLWEGAADWHHSGMPQLLATTTLLPCHGLRIFLRRGMRLSHTQTHTPPPAS